MTYVELFAIWNRRVNTGQDIVYRPFGIANVRCEIALERTEHLRTVAVLNRDEWSETNADPNGSNVASMNFATSVLENSTVLARRALVQQNW